MRLFPRLHTLSQFDGVVRLRTWQSGDEILKYWMHLHVDPVSGARRRQRPREKEVARGGGWVRTERETESNRLQVGFADVNRQDVEERFKAAGVTDLLMTTEITSPV